jgi:hypothetical protein
VGDPYAGTGDDLQGPASNAAAVTPSDSGGASRFYAPGSVIPSGTVLSVFQAVATALVNAGAAEYV